MSEIKANFNLESIIGSTNNTLSGQSQASKKAGFAVGRAGQKSVTEKSSESKDNSIISSGEDSSPDAIHDKYIKDVSTAKISSPIGGMESQLAKITAGTAQDVAFSLMGGALGPALKAASRSIQDGFLYEFRRALPGKNLPGANAMEDAPVTITASQDNTKTVPTQLDLYRDIEKRVIGIPAFQEYKPVVVESLEKARDYLGLENELIVSEISPSSINRVKSSDGVIHRGFSPEVNNVEVDKLRWDDVDSYVKTRLGALACVLDVLNEKDHIRFSNIPLEQSIADLPKIERAETFKLPISSWSKDIHLLTHPGGKKTLIISNFDGKTLLKHFELLVKRRLHGKESIPEVSVLESKSIYENQYNKLKDFFREKKDETGRIDAVVVGYDNAFQEDWNKYHLSPVHSKSSSWSADIYELPDNKRVAVLASKDSYHGEILGENLKRLVNDNPEIKYVFTAGSAGSTHIRDPYSIVFPDHILGESGVEMKNVLSGGSGQLSHVSVISPMAETPDFLNQAMEKQITTIDMEMGHVASALAKCDVKLGVGILVTDFPVERKISRNVNLTFQDPGQKYKSMKSYTSALFNYLTEGKPVYENEIEIQAGKTLEELSTENMDWEMNKIGQMTPDEKVLFDRITGLLPKYSFRMKTNRLARILEDGAILSTAQVARLKNVEVSPYTPKVEDEMYGAFEYTFGEIGFGDGNPEYGEVEVRIKPETLQARSWATYRSGWRALKIMSNKMRGKSLSYDSADPALMKKARERFGEWVVVPKDYRRSMAAWAIRQVRKKDPAIKQELLDSPIDKLPEFLNKYDLAYLEGKIKGSLNIGDIEQVIIPSDCPRELLMKLEELGITAKRRAEI
ncbi:MAG: hypothetical protein K8T10_05235 [Candidatus Eremiobacteraeota bacterium]|nr:hypothetical protein [Candidatus Eremiobacteraeota bacterium]